MRSLAKAMVCLCIFVLGCASPIPNQVQPDEYAVYSTWITRRFQKEPPKALYIGNFTKSFGQSDAHCKAELKKNGVSSAMVKALQDLGTTHFPLQSDTSRLQIPYAYEYSSLENAKAPDLRYIELTRVAFNTSQTEGLFAYNDSTCIDGYCGGGGGAVLAVKIDGKWQFRFAGCRVVQ